MFEKLKGAADAALENGRRNASPWGFTTPGEVSRSGQVAPEKRTEGQKMDVSVGQANDWYINRS